MFRAITAPLDTIKIRLQLQKKVKPLGGAYVVFKDLVRHEGVYGLWKGNVPAEIMYILYGAIQFMSYSIINKQLNSLLQAHDIKIRNTTHSLVVGIGAGISSTIATYPFDLLRTRLVAHSGKNFLSMVTTIKQIYKLQGPQGFYLGVQPAMISVASTTGLMFWTYAVSRNYSAKYHNIPFIEAICGFVAGATAKGITFPLDTLRKRIQMNRFDYFSKKNILSLGIKIFQNEGISGLYKGFGISIMKTAPTSAITMFVYEYTLSKLMHV